jgi:hypothetical protein
MIYTSSSIQCLEAISSSRRKDRNTCRARAHWRRAGQRAAGFHAPPVPMCVRCDATLVNLSPAHDRGPSPNSSMARLDLDCNLRLLVSIQVQASGRLFFLFVESARGRAASVSDARSDPAWRRYASVRPRTLEAARVSMCVPAVYGF